MKLQAITLMNGASTPAAVVFQPFTGQYQQNPAEWFNHKVDTSRLDDKKLTLRVSLTGTRDKVTAKLDIPFAPKAAEGCCTPATTNSPGGLINIEVAIPREADDAFKKDLYAYIKSFVSTAEFKTAVENLDPVIG